jgi:nucleoid-associated protein YgaU
LTKASDELRVGAEIDAQCTRCRRPTNHRIVSMMEGSVKHVICLTCQSKHNYRPPAEPPKKAPAAAKAGAAPKAAAPKPAKPKAPPKPKAPKEAKDPKEAKKADEDEQAARLWRERRESYGGSPPEAYSMQALYRADQAIEHPTFGLGFVTKLLPPGKFEAVFERSVKTLVMDIGRVRKL